ncbi:MAG: sulfatase-like hydrolase/transferase, partial [Acidobacteria bacterium]|nr:sulfatase-like hydrolase/transferase [Acidobacteriota bacterium]
MLVCAVITGAVIVAAAWWLFPFARDTGRPVLGRVNLLLVTIDTLRADRVGGELTPAINALARHGASFAEARSVVPLTLPAHASLMTGLLPPNHGVRLNGVHRLSPDRPTLARLLKSAGYRTAAVIGAYVLDRRFGLAEGFETYDDDIARGDREAGLLEAERRGDVVAARALAWLQAQPDDGRPFYLWVHLYDPHAPYDPPPAWLDRAHGQPYDGEVAYADAQLGRIVDALAARGLLDSTLIVVAGDHGESLGDHGEQTHGLLVYEKAVDIPLVFSAAALTASIRTDAASLVDVFPTVLGLLGMPPPPRHDGRDLFAPGAARVEAEAYAETLYPEAAGCSPLYALASGRWKYIGGPAVPELYDLAADPGEQRDVTPDHRPVADAMGSRIAAITSRGVASVPTALSRDAAERLRALGYVAATPATAAPGGSAAPSPTTLVRNWERFQQAVADLAAGRRDRALNALADLVRAHPDASLFHANYARALDESGNPHGAVDTYRRALARWPQNTTLLHGYAVAARDADMRDVAMKAEEAVLAIDPTDAAAQNGI